MRLLLACAAAFLLFVPACGDDTTPSNDLSMPTVMDMTASKKCSDILTCAVAAATPADALNCLKLPGLSDASKAKANALLHCGVMQCQGVSTVDGGTADVDAGTAACGSDADITKPACFACVLGKKGAQSTPCMTQLSACAGEK